jgi:REP element-mobilizing transposase RayT
MRQPSQRIFAVGEVYHVYNRGVEKRAITDDEKDSTRFVESIAAFNTSEPIGSIYQQSFYKSKSQPSRSNPITKSPVVRLLAYCLNPNHYHMLVKPLVDNGLSIFMHKFGVGYTRYYNERHKRSGALFQGRFKARHITSHGDLLRMSAYVNLNDRVHQLSNPITKLVRSSFEEYAPQGKRGLCGTSTVLDSFQSKGAYKKFADTTIREIVNDRKSAADDDYKKELYAAYFE